MLLWWSLIADGTALSSVYIAPSPLPPNERQLFCAKDVPKVVHTTVVDSLALRAAMSMCDFIA